MKNFYRVLAAVFAVIVVSAFYVIPSFAETTVKSEEKPNQPVAGSATQYRLFNPDFNQMPEQEFEIRIDLGLCSGNHIGGDFDTGVRFSAEGIFPIAADIGVFGNLGISSSMLDSKSSLGFTAGTQFYGYSGFDTGMMFDWFHPDDGVNIYQVRLFAQSAWSATDRLGVRLALPLGKAIFDGGPYGIEWNFELAFYSGAYWQHSWIDELSSELGFYWVAGDVDEIMYSACVVYYFNEHFNFLLSSNGQFSGDDMDIGLYIEFKIGPGAARKTTFDRLRFYHLGVSSYGSAILNIPNNKYAPEWNARQYW